MGGDSLNNTGGTDSLVIRVKYGATTIWSGTVSAVNNGANRGSLTLEIELMAFAATNSQKVTRAFMQVGDSTQNNAGGTGASLVSTNSYTVYGNNTGSITEDSTAAKNFVVTAQMGASDANRSTRIHTGYLEVK
jgi:hypothetical protein